MTWCHEATVAPWGALSVDLHHYTEKKTSFTFSNKSYVHVIRKIRTKRYAICVLHAFVFDMEHTAHIFKWGKISTNEFLNLGYFPGLLLQRMVYFDNITVLHIIPPLFPQIETRVKSNFKEKNCKFSCNKAFQSLCVICIMALIISMNTDWWDFLCAWLSLNSNHILLSF